MNIDDIFLRGLHKLSLAQLVTLADDQNILMNSVSHKDLVYLIQELTSRISELDKSDETALDPALHGVEFNG